METIIIFISIIILAYLPNIKESIDKLINYLEKRFKKNKIMKKYKLIKEYPGSRKKNTIVNIASDNIHVLINGVCSPLNPQEIMDYPEYWQEIIEKDYKILSLARLCTIKPTITDVSDYGDEYIEALLKCDKSRIHSVKRKDGEIFTIGDRVTYGKNTYGELRTISEISLSKTGRIFLSYEEDVLTKYDDWLCSNFQHYKEPLFTTDFEVTIWSNPDQPNEHSLIDRGNWNIQQVRRLSDNVRFKIGDYIKEGRIINIIIKNFKIYLDIK